MYRIVISPPKAGQPATLGAHHDTGGDLTPSRRSARKVANAELLFEGALAGLTLTGFSIFDNGHDGVRVSFPTRRFTSAGGGPGSYLLLRATNAEDRTTYERLKGEILDAFRAFNATLSTQHTEAAS